MQFLINLLSQYWVKKQKQFVRVNKWNHTWEQNVGGTILISCIENSIITKLFIRLFLSIYYRRLVFIKVHESYYRSANESLGLRKIIEINTKKIKKDVYAKKAFCYEVFLTRNLVATIIE